MNPRTLLLIPLLLTLSVACDPEVADIETDQPDDRPDVTGSYTVTLTELEGCDQGQGDLTWMQGALQITGEPGSLELEFAGGDVLIGVVDASYSLDAEATVRPVDRDQDVVFAGIVVLGDAGWDIDGDVLADVIDSTDDSITCTLSGRMEAQQIP